MSEDEVKNIMKNTESMTYKKKSIQDLKQIKQKIEIIKQTLLLNIYIS